MRQWKIDNEVVELVKTLTVEIEELKTLGESGWREKSRG
jgi:hypothetical protein